MSTCRISRHRLDRELACRAWSATDLAQAAGIIAATIVAARKGKPVTASTLRKISVALTRAPVIPTAELLLAEDDS